MREGPQLGVAKAARAPPCTLPILGRRLESYYFLHMPEEITSQIKRLAPLLEEDSDVFRELSTFFGDGAKIEMHRDDLSKFLQDNRTFEVVRVSGKSYKDCVYELVDNYPEMMDAIGMLRYYKAPAGKIKWEEVEAAEIAMGNELTTNAYGWAPDAWTIFESSDTEHSLVAIVALDSLL